MPEEKEVNEVLGNKKKDAGANLTLSLADLNALIANLNAQSEAKFDKLVEAIIESKKPFVDPRKEKNDEMFRESSRKQREILAANMKASQEWCQHLQGSNALSKIPGQLTCIVRHRLDTTEVVGLCTNCGRIWREGDPDYAEWMRKASGNEISSAGQRSFLDPTAVKKAGR